LITSGLVVSALPVPLAYRIIGLSLDLFLGGAWAGGALLHSLAPFLEVLHIVVNDGNVAESVIYDDTVFAGKRDGLSVNLQRMVGDLFLLGVIGLSIIVFDQRGAEVKPGHRIVRIGFRRVDEKLLGASKVTLVV